jgi:hypothetical protein
VSSVLTRLKIGCSGGCGGLHNKLPTFIRIGAAGSRYVRSLGLRLGMLSGRYPRKLRIGIVKERAVLPRWVVSIRRIAVSAGVEINIIYFALAIGYRRVTSPVV